MNWSFSITNKFKPNLVPKMGDQFIFWGSVFFRPSRLPKLLGRVFYLPMAVWTVTHADETCERMFGGNRQQVAVTTCGAVPERPFRQVPSRIRIESIVPVI